MSDSSSTTSGGIGFLGLLAILFIGLKLTGYISWPWGFVLAPLWPAMIIIAIGIIFLLVWLVALIYSAIKS